MANRSQDQQPPRRPGNEQSGSTGRKPGTGDEKQDGKDSGQDRYGMTGGADRNAPQPGHDSGSSGTSEYGRSDYGEPGDRDPDSNAGPESRSPSQVQKPSVAVSPPGNSPKQHRR